MAVFKREPLRLRMLGNGCTFSANVESVVKATQHSFPMHNLLLWVKIDVRLARRTFGVALIRAPRISAVL
jgi:hypothetical protein